jgi:hypothetical protein
MRSQVLVAHACNPSYSGGLPFKTILGQIRDIILKIPNIKTGLAE